MARHTSVAWNPSRVRWRAEPLRAILFASLTMPQHTMTRPSTICREVPA
jgi:hypothetical protein